MVSSTKQACESLITSLQAAVTPHTVLVPQNDCYEIKKVPSLIVIGPKVEENKEKRVTEKLQSIDIDALSYSERLWPRYNNLDFELLLTASTGAELLALQELVSVFFIDTKSIVVGDSIFNIVETTPVGGLDRPNLSNLRQSSGKCRIEDVEVFGTAVETGKLAVDRVVNINDRETGAQLFTRTIKHSNIKNSKK